MLRTNPPRAASCRRYVLTGSKQWLQALRSERRALIEAFATNTTVENANMSDCMIDDELADAWARVLAQPKGAKGTCALRSLRLESNPISSAGVETLASALRVNTSLTELSLSNLRGRVSKEAEEVRAAAPLGVLSLSLARSLTHSTHPFSLHLCVRARHGLSHTR